MGSKEASDWRIARLHVLTLLLRIVDTLRNFFYAATDDIKINFESLSARWVVPQELQPREKLKLGLRIGKGLSDRHSRVEYLAYLSRQSARGERLSDKGRSLV